MCCLSWLYYYYYHSRDFFGLIFSPILFIYLDFYQDNMFDSIILWVLVFIPVSSESILNLLLYPIYLGLNMFFWNYLGLQSNKGWVFNEVDVSVKCYHERTKWIIGNLNLPNLTLHFIPSNTSSPHPRSRPKRCPYILVYNVSKTAYLLY